MTDTLLSPANISALAGAFAALLQRDLTPEQWMTMRVRNLSPDYQHGACASHDFIDANMTMGEAFMAIMGREAAGSYDDHRDPETGALVANDPREEAAAMADSALWNAAWKLAKRDYLTAPVIDYSAPVVGAVVEYQNGQLATFAHVHGGGFAVLHEEGFSDRGDWIPARLEVLNGEEVLTFVADDEDARATLAEAIAAFPAAAPRQTMTPAPWRIKSTFRRAEP